MSKPRQSLSSSSLHSEPAINSRRSIGGQQQREDGGGRRRSTARQSLAPQGMSSRQSLGVSRQSIGFGRRSSVHGSSAFVKDPRRIGDKAYKEQSIERLIGFLADNGYGYPVSPKLLHAPSHKDFMNILQFLYNKIDPNHKFPTQAYEDEIPILFKKLGYPMRIRKQDLFAGCVGTPHVWSQLLGALTWLIELIVSVESTDLENCLYGGSFKDGLDDDMEDDGVNENRVFFDYLSKAYAAFLAGDDNFEALDKELADSFEERNAIVAQELEKYEEGIHQKTAQLEEMRDQPNAVSALTEERDEFRNVLEKLEAYITALAEHVTKVEDRVTQKEMELTECDTTLKEILAKKKEMEAVLDVQELNPADVERMNHTRAELSKSLRAVAAQQEDIQDQIWAREEKVTGKMQEIEQLIKDYNALAEKIEILPVNAKNAHDLDLELRLNFSKPRPEQDLKVNLKGFIKPSLQKLKDRFNVEAHDANQRLLEITERKDQLRENAQDKQDEVSIHQSKLDALESHFEEERDLLSRDQKDRAEDLHELQNDLQRMRLTATSGLNEAEIALESITAFSTEEEIRRESEVTEMRQLITNTTGMILEHKEHIAGRLANLEKTLQKTLLESRDQPI